MKEKFEKIVLRIDDLKERYKSNESKHRLMLGIAVFILSPCAFVLKFNINSVVKIILTLFVALFMLEIILAISPFILLYHIWFRSNLKSIGKIVTTFFIVLFLILCCIVGAKQGTNTGYTTSTTNEVKESLTVDDNTKENLTEDFTKETTTEATTEFEWLSAIGNSYTGVELYIVTDDTTTLYGVVTDYDTKLHRVQVYLKEADSFMWFPTREVSFLNKLKVRSDDPRLPN